MAPAKVRECEARYGCLELKPTRTFQSRGMVPTSTPKYLKIKMIIVQKKRFAMIAGLQKCVRRKKAYFDPDLVVTGRNLGTTNTAWPRRNSRRLGSHKCRHWPVTGDPFVAYFTFCVPEFAPISTHGLHQGRRSRRCPPVNIARTGRGKFHVP